MMKTSSALAFAIVILGLLVALISQTSGGLMDIYDDGTLVAQRGGINLVSGAGIAVTSADDPGNTRVNLTVGVTARSGTATVANGTTSIAVTHGLGSTPDRVLITPTADTNGITWWVDTVGATTFNIKMDSDPGADKTFDWRAFLEES